MHSWSVGDFFAAFYLEQTIIETLKRLGLERHAGDWFETDWETIAGVWNVVDDLAYEVKKWERTNFKWQNYNYQLSCDALQSESPYGITRATIYGEKVKKLPKGYFGHGLLQSGLTPA